MASDLLSLPDELLVEIASKLGLGDVHSFEHRLNLAAACSRLHSAVVASIKRMKHRRLVVIGDESDVSVCSVNGVRMSASERELYCGSLRMKGTADLWKFGRPNELQLKLPALFYKPKLGLMHEVLPTIDPCSLTHLMIHFTSLPDGTATEKICSQVLSPVSHLLNLERLYLNVSENAPITPPPLSLASVSPHLLPLSKLCTLKISPLLLPLAEQAAFLNLTSAAIRQLCCPAFSVLRTDGARSAVDSGRQWLTTLVGHLDERVRHNIHGVCCVLPAAPMLREMLDALPNCASVVCGMWQRVEQSHIDLLGAQLLEYCQTMGRCLRVVFLVTDSPRVVRFAVEKTVVTVELGLDSHCPFHGTHRSCLL